MCPWACRECWLIDIVVHVHYCCSVVSVNNKNNVHKFSFRNISRSRVEIESGSGRAGPRSPPSITTSSLNRYTLSTRCETSLKVALVGPRTPRANRNVKRLDEPPPSAPRADGAAADDAPRRDRRARPMKARPGLRICRHARAGLARDRRGERAALDVTKRRRLGARLAANGGRRGEDG